MHAIAVVDAFTAEPFAGNPAAVCVLEAGAPVLSDGWMQAVARELNLSETAFVSVGASADAAASELGLRWFTPTTEVDLCGHATLATAHLLWERGIAAHSVELAFATRSGTLRASYDDGRITIDLPATMPERCPVPDGLADRLGAETIATLRTPHALIVVVSDSATVRTLEPDIGAIADDAEIVVVTARGGVDDDADVVSRVFGPALGIPEDPVTGAAHAVLGPYWAGVLDVQAFDAEQASSRGGTMRVEVRGDRAYLTGTAVTVWEGALVAATG